MSILFYRGVEIGRQEIEEQIHEYCGKSYSLILFSQYKSSDIDKNDDCLEQILFPSNSFLVTELLKSQDMIENLIRFMFKYFSYKVTGIHEGQVLRIEYMPSIYSNPERILFKRRMIGRMFVFLNNLGLFLLSEILLLIMIQEYKRLFPLVEQHTLERVHALVLEWDIGNKRLVSPMLRKRVANSLVKDKLEVVQPPVSQPVQPPVSRQVQLVQPSQPVQPPVSRQPVQPPVSRQSVQPSHPIPQNILCFNGLTYDRNSCYQDSVFVATFAIPNDFISDEILGKRLSEEKHPRCGENDLAVRRDLQAEINELTLHMRGIHKQNNLTCGKIRALLANCKLPQEFHKYETQDAGEFLQTLFNIFNVDTGITLQSIVSGRNTDGSYDVLTNRTSNVTPIITVYAAEYKNGTIVPSIIMKKTNIEDGRVMTSPDGTSKYYELLRMQSVYSNPKICIFYVQRLDMSGRKLNVPVQIQERIGRLNLTSIIVHRSNHYTCYLKCENVWYYYNDVSNSITKIDDLNDIGNLPSPSIEGVLYYYY